MTEAVLCVPLHWLKWYFAHLQVGSSFTRTRPWGFEIIPEQDHLKFSSSHLQTLLGVVGWQCWLWNLSVHLWLPLFLSSFFSVCHCQFLMLAVSGDCASECAWWYVTLTELEMKVASKRLNWAFCFCFAKFIWKWQWTLRFKQLWHLSKEDSKASSASAKNVSCVCFSCVDIV